MTVEEINQIVASIENISEDDENAYEKIIFQLLKIKRFPVLIYEFPQGHFFFRSRTHGEEEFFTSLNDISITPSNFIHSFGRCNRPHQSKFYVSENRPTSFMELVEYWSENKKVGDKINVTIGRWQLLKPLNCIIITTPDVEKRVSVYDIENGKILDAFIENSDEKIREATKHLYRYFFEKFRKPSKNDLKNYLITSAITNVCLTISNNQADCIQYPSVPFDGEGDNFAINKDFITDENIKLVGALNNELTIVSENENGTFNFEETNNISTEDIDYKNRRIIW
ncbi:RES domain-containing protein [Kaistella jeonii]|uniref:Uncharacterized protein n=1 Tax=Kaistella jeonii TaxID=266749 RepID=A0A0C1FB21_9FLAO|nr:RES domain-containing protein [Kaistella jeonii]KIA90332.1 hypothetical protein OA86_00010 [Kaistella jeonii]SFB74386.1 RES domain-containing protein [Kaistella jeonii]VEI95124.1 Uncharacterised protein [Kaistella jeonii]